MKGSNTNKYPFIRGEKQLPDVLAEETMGSIQALLYKSGEKSLNLSYFNQSKTITS